ncbi:esterase-like activity of phytase family protein [soil metagenome]
MNYRLKQAAVVAGGLMLLPVSVLAQSATPVASPIPAVPSISATYTLPSIPLGQYQDAALPDYPIADDHGFELGGIGSDLWHDTGAPADEFWMVTDRGPNGEVEVDGEARVTFPVPDFTPIILHVKLVDGEIEILDALPIVGESGAPVTGVANLESQDAQPYNFDGSEAIPFNPSGLDTEGLVRTAAGDFWLADEYSPSIIHVSAEGQVIARYVPEGLALEGADYPVYDTLPAIYAERRGNRGFEGLAISGDGTTLFAALQSPLYVPDSETGKASVNTRILAVDVATGTATAEYVYQFDDVNEFDPSQEGKADAMKLSGIVWINDTTLLINERTDPVAKLYAVDLSSATNILGGPFDDATTAPSLEASNDLSTVDVTPVAKKLVVDSTSLGELPIKIEGVAVIDENTIAIANDNDFQITEIGPDGKNIPTGVPSQIFIIEVPGGI